MHDQVDTIGPAGIQETYSVDLIMHMAHPHCGTRFAVAVDVSEVPFPT